MVVEPYRRGGSGKRGLRLLARPRGVFELRNRDTLDGLLSSGGLRRAAWFAHKGYVEITGQLVSVGISGFMVAGIAGIDSDLQTGRMILGKRESLDALDDGPVEVVFRNVNRLNSSLKEGEAFVRAERIPDSGVLDNPLVTIAGMYPVINGEVRVRLQDFGVGEAYTILLGRTAEGSAATVAH